MEKVFKLLGKFIGLAVAVVVFMTGSFVIDLSAEFDGSAMIEEAAAVTVTSEPSGSYEPCSYSGQVIGSFDVEASDYVTAGSESTEYCAFGGDFYTEIHKLVRSAVKELNSIDYDIDGMNDSMLAGFDGVIEAIGVNVKAVDHISVGIDTVIDSVDNIAAGMSGVVSGMGSVASGMGSVVNTGAAVIHAIGIAIIAGSFAMAAYYVCGILAAIGALIDGRKKAAKQPAAAEEA